MRIKTCWICNRDWPSSLAEPIDTTPVTLKQTAIWKKAEKPAFFQDTELKDKFEMKKAMNSTKPFESIILTFEAEIIKDLIDPFDSFSLKILTFVIYLIDVLASAIILAFVAYETGM